MDKICSLCQIAKKENEYRLCVEKRNKHKPPKQYACSWCKECERKKALDKYRQNREKCIKDNKRYKENNKDKINETTRHYTACQMKDPIKRLIRDMKCLLSSKIKKTDSSNVYLGASTEVIRRWFEWNFNSNMTWENRGTVWQIDHTIPINSFDLTNKQQCMLCFNWKNLMPLETLRNIHKGDFILPYRVFHQEKQLRDFVKKYKTGDDIDDYIKKYSYHFKTSFNKQSATRPKCGKLLRALTTTLFEKS